MRFSETDRTVRDKKYNKVSETYWMPNEEKFSLNSSENIFCRFFGILSLNQPVKYDLMVFYADVNRWIHRVPERSPYDITRSIVCEAPHKVSNFTKSDLYSIIISKFSAN